MVVRPKGKPVPSSAADARAVAAAQKALLAQAKRLAHPKLKARQVELGNSASNGLEDLQMFPAKLTVPAGTVVTFTMSTHTRETHTATFGPLSYLSDLANAFIGQQGQLDSRGVYPSDPAMPIVLTSTAHGNGFANTGALDRDSNTPLKPSGTIKFTTPGVYHFICLIHPFMHGTITVK